MRTDFQLSSTRLIVYLLIANSFVTAAGFGYLSIIDSSNITRFIGSLLFIPVFGSLLLILKRGHLGSVKWIAVSLNFSLILLQVWLDGGIKSPDFFTLLIGIILATLAFGFRGAALTCCLSLAAGYVFPFLQTAPNVYSARQIMVIQYSTFLTIVFYFYFSIRLYKNESNRNVQLSEKLAGNEAKLREMIMNLPMSAMIVRYTGEIDLLNKRLSQVLGYTREDLKKIDDWFSQAYLDPQVRTERMTFWQEHALNKEEKLIATEMEVYSKARKPITFEVHAAFLENEIVFLLNDITARKEAENALRVSEEKFRAITEQASESIILINEQGKITQANKAFEEISGFRVEEIIGLYYWDMQAQITPPELRSLERTERNKMVTLNALQTGQSPLITQPVEAIFINKDGEKKTVLNSTFLIRSGDGNRFCSIAVDITERKRSEEKSMLQQSQLLEAERKRREILETIESISFDLRKAENRKDFYIILLEKCVHLLGAGSGLVFEPVNGEYVLAMNREINWPGNDSHQVKQMNSRLAEFSESNESVSVLHDTFSNQPTILVKLLSAHQLFGFLVLIWQHSQVTDDTYTILQTIAEISGIALDRMRILETLEERVKTRTREIRVLYEFMQLYVSNEDILSVIKESLNIFMNTVHADSCVFFMADQAGDQFRLVSLLGGDLEVAHQEQNHTLRDFGWEPVLTSDKPVLLKEPLFPFKNQPGNPPSNANRFIGVPVRTQKGLLAVIGFVYAQEINISLDELNFINLFSDQIGMVIERDVLRQQVKKSVVIEERQRLSRELHDSLTQSLYSLKLVADAGVRLAGQQKWDDVKIQLDTVFEISTQALKEMRLLVYELIPETIEVQGLVAALDQRLNYVERRSGVEVEFTHEGPMDLSLETQLNLYRIAQEALNNAAKHAAATKIQLHLASGYKQVLLGITDNGKGFDPEGISPGMGLKNMRDRAQQLGGEIKIDSQPGIGTSIEFTMRNDRYE